MVHHSSSVEETQRLGRILGEVAKAGDSIALIGDLGAGKTHLIQAIATGLGVPSDVRVTSPTFTLVNIYRGGRMTLVHADLYRLEREAELVELGLDDWIGDEALVCVEWADRFAALPNDALEVRMDVSDATSRRIEISALGPLSMALYARFEEALSS